MDKKHSRNHPNSTSYVPENPADEDDQFEQLNNPYYVRDVVKAIMAIFFLAFVFHGVPHLSDQWKQRVSQVKSRDASKTENSVVAPSERPEVQTPQRPEKQSLGDGTRVVVQTVKDDDANMRPSRHSEVNLYNNVFSVKVDFAPRIVNRPEQDVPNLGSEPRLDPQFDPQIFTYFDNAGKSYPTKAARDRAEVRRLEQSLAAYPAMSSEQREIMRRRAFARLEQLDMDQRTLFAP